MTHAGPAVSARRPVLASARSAPSTVSRLFRYGGVSAISAGLAQAALTLGYGVLGWSTTVAVGFSLAASVVPAYWLNRRCVWGDRVASYRRAPGFFAMAVAGSAVAALTTHLSEHLARSATDNHALLTLAVNGAALATMLVIWLLRFVAFDRFVFVDGRARTALRIQR